jgi:hypothetical protein
MTFSALYSLVHVYGNPKYRWLNITLDAFIAAFLFGVIVPHCVGIRSQWGRRWWDNGKVMLGSFGAAFMMVNL